MRIKAALGRLRWALPPALGCLLSALPVALATALGGGQAALGQVAAAPAGLAAAVGVAAYATEVGPATRAVYLDNGGVIRWRDSNREVALFGANYCIMSGSDYRMAGLVDHQRKAMIDEDLAHFARMGWTALRLCSWGDWENSDRAGNLIVNEHVDLLDYLVAKARERGIYILLTPIHTYDPAFADQLDRPSQNIGFSRYFDRQVMGTDPQSIAAQVNYISQLLNHRNPYTGVALKDEPALLFIEMINEPVHHSEDLQGSIRYINALVNAVRSTGCTKLTFFNISQDFAIAPAIQQSRVDGVSFGWYPTGLVAGHTLHGNFLQAVDQYPDMLRPELAHRPRIVYEFDQADLLSGYLYPAMARTFRSVGAQLATMFAYDMLQTAPFNLGWQTHYLNLVHTPRKAMSAVIAAEVMRRLPGMHSYGRYPEDQTFGDFRVVYAQDRSELNAKDAYLYAGSTASAPRNPRSLERIAGVGSSPVVSYEGSGAYFLDKIRSGVWRLEVYPDEVLVRDPFEQPQPGKVVSRLLYRSWPMSVHLPDLGEQLSLVPLNVPGDRSHQSVHVTEPTFMIEPGVWLLSSHQSLDPSSLPARIARVGLTEFHVNERVSYPDLVLPLAPTEFSQGTAVELRIRVASDTLPDDVQLWVRPAGMRSFGKAIPMHRVLGNDYVATLAAETERPGLYEYVVSTRTGTREWTFPGPVARHPAEWPFRPDTVWSFHVVPAGSALRILNPREDYSKLSFVRPGERYRTPFFQIVPGESSDEAALSLTLPDLGKETPERYAAALYIGEAVSNRKRDAAQADSLEIKFRAVGGTRKTLHLSLIERDGSAWSAPVVAGKAWSTVRIRLSDLQFGRSIHIPSPFPGLWNYWRTGPAQRGSPGDHIRLEDVERLQLLVAAEDAATDDAKSVEVESVLVHFDAANMQGMP